MNDGVFDLVVVGGGMGGLATAAMAGRLGMRVALLEAHSKLGGCAGHFSRGAFTFDAGATALMGLGPGEPLGAFLRYVGVELGWESRACYRMCLPDRTFELVTDRAAFEGELARVFPGGDWRKRCFWRLQAAVGETLLAAACRIPRFPIQSLGDLAHDLRVLGLSGVGVAGFGILTVLDVLRLMGLAGDRPFQTLLAMLLQDTAQAGPKTVPFANAAACLQAYRRGLCRPRGGMRGLTEGIGARIAELGGTLRLGTLVDRVEGQGGDEGFDVVTRRRERIRARQVVLNLPLDLSARLLGRSLEGALARRERRTRPAWSAFTGYVALDRAAVPDDTPLFHHVLSSYDAPLHEGNNVLVSLSAPDDAGYGPSDVRVATLSTHTDPIPWEGLDRAEHDARKACLGERLVAALERALPGSSAALVHAEFGTPRSFARYTRRTRGAVGGPPVGRGNSNLRAVGSDVFGPGVWVVGDSVFPGQGTLAVVLSAMRVVERVSGMSSREMLGGELERASPPRVDPIESSLAP